MELSLAELQQAVAEYLRNRSVTVTDLSKIQIEMLSSTGQRFNFVGVTTVVVAYDVKLPEGPYR